MLMAVIKIAPPPAEAFGAPPDPNEVGEVSDPYGGIFERYVR